MSIRLRFLTRLRLCRSRELFPLRTLAAQRWVSALVLESALALMWKSVLAMVSASILETLFRLEK